MRTASHYDDFISAIIFHSNATAGIFGLCIGKIVSISENAKNNENSSTNSSNTSSLVSFLCSFDSASATILRSVSSLKECSSNNGQLIETRKRRKYYVNLQIRK